MIASPSAISSNTLNNDKALKPCIARIGPYSEKKDISDLQPESAQAHTGNGPRRRTVPACAFAWVEKPF